MTEEVITPEVVETVDAAPAVDAPVEPTVDAVQPDAPAEPQVIQAPELSDSAQTVRAWIRSMAAIAPHHGQVTFETFLIDNIASLDEFDAALGG